MSPTVESGAAEAPEHINDVRLQGRLAAPASERELPSGDTLAAFRVVVDRPRLRGETRRRVDAIECVAWSARVRRAAARWGPGDLIQVTGTLRRRFRRTDAGPVSRVEVEVATARRIG